ncbi:MAG: hypothetical protein JWR06_1579 [Jatrophihabitans sp.]|jgi:uncharacterized Zn-binding protein involved in type VI secretion|nr:hypothetical protein [Jatrophihabitans sp.]MDT4902893.1 hypothetical protein [Pseudonocardiales bacterium]MDT4930549.1 hypothetical protein [Pseudonocardiales bacterium]MDT4950254.1 hypothetical protein [Pseudonocardiales bacterium]
MPLCAVTGAMLQCTFGLAPSTLVALPTPRVMIEGRPAAVVTSTITGANIPPFGMCSSLSNPTVAAATSAALGVLTPMPCIPTIVGPWVPGAMRTTLGGVPALTAGSQCVCAFGGVVTMTMSGAVRTQAN